MSKLGFSQPHSYKIQGVFRASQIAGFLFALVFMVSASPTFAQTSQGFTGVVADQTGAVVPKAKVIVHNHATGVDKAVVTTNTGAYAVPFLSPGIYDVTAEASGFKRENKTDITLSTDQTATVDFRLELGAVTETVSVNSSADVLDYDKADRGQVIDGISVTQLPIQAEDPYTLAQQVAGAYNNLNPTSIGPYNQTAQSLSIHANQVQLNIDGLDNQSMTGSQNYEYDPPEGTLQEFRVSTEPFDAAAGRSSGGAVDMTMKTGGQKLHGVAYELLRPGFLQANTPINNALIAKNGPSPTYEVPAQHYDQYGFEVDGPVIIPKLWHSNKQTFFMLSWQAIDQLQNTTVSGSVPTQAMIGNGTQYPGQGDFSALLTANGAKYNQPIYDPASQVACTANNTDTGSYGNSTPNPHACRYQWGYGPGSARGPQGNPMLIGTPNVIPANRLNPTALAIMSWYAYPNQAPSATTANDFNSNYFQNNPTTAKYNNVILKLDQNRGNSDVLDLQLRGFIDYGTSINGDPRENVNPSHPGLNFAGYGAHFNSHMRELGFVTGWTHTFSPHLINSAKVMLTISDQTDNTGPPGAFNPGLLGFPSSYGTYSGYFDRFPSITPGNYNVLGSISGLKRGDNKIDAVDTFNWNHGNHTIHFGGEFMPYQYAQRTTNGAGSSINLSVGKGWSQQWDIVTAGGTGLTKGAGYSGNSIASMESGTWDSGNATTQPTNFYSLKYGNAFFQDDWKVRSNLTLNLGVRWDKPIAGNIERHNQQTYIFDTTDVNPINSMVSASSLPISTALLGGITFAGVNGNPRAPWAVVYYEFGPRAGFAYSYNSKTVIRGGMGLFYSETGNQYQPPQTGYSSSTTYTGTLDSGITPQNNLSNPFPTFQTPIGNCGGNQSQCLETNAGQALTFYNPHWKFNPVLNSSLGFERQLSRSDTVEVSYAGMRAYNTSYSDDLNHISAAAQAACDPERGGPESNCTGGSTTGTIGYVTNPFKGLAPFVASGTYYTAAYLQKLNFTRPFPIFTSVTESNLNGGKSWYNALEVVYTHRTSKGLTLHGTYAYSHLMGASGYVDTINRIPQRGIGGSDTPHRITINGVYVLPFARGRGFFPGMNRAVDVVAGGWQVSSTLLVQSGIPFGISGYEINPTANGGYILPRKRFWGGNTNSYWPANQGVSSNSYIQAFKPCVGTRDTTTGAITLTTYSIAAGCAQANFVQLLSTSGVNYSVTPNVIYSGIRLQRIVEQDADISKTFKIYDNINLQLRMDVFNLANHVIQSSSGYDTTVGDSNFGTYQMGSTGGSNYPDRQYQFVGRVTW